MNQLQKDSVSTVDGPMTVWTAVPAETSKRRPAMIVVQEAFGVTSHIKDICDRFSQLGFVATAPELFHRSGDGLDLPYGNFEAVKPIFSKVTNAQIVEDVQKSFEYLKSREDVDPEKIYIIGFCMGGFASMLAACHLPELAGAISMYGGGIVNSRPGLGLTPFIHDFDKISCPCLLFFGEDDAGIPMSDVKAIDDRLKSTGKDYQITVYPSAGHAFFCDARPSYNKDAADDAWAKCKKWLKSDQL